MAKKKTKARKPSGPEKNIRIEQLTRELHGHFSADRLAEATNSLDELIGLSPRDVDLLNFLSLYALQLQQPHKALGLLRTAHRLDPSHLDSICNLGICSYEIGNFADSASFFAKASRLSPHDPEIHYNLGNSYKKSRDFPQAIEAFRKAISLKRDYQEAYNNLALTYEETGEITKAVDCYRKVLSLDGHHDGALIRLNSIYSSHVRRWHFAMMNDTVRNEAFREAITKAVTEDSLVLEIGTGSGLLAMMAAEAGAAHVYTCETNPLIARKAEEIIAANRLQDRISVIRKNSLHIVTGKDIPAPCDVLIAEIFDTGLLGEGVFTVFNHARQYLLAGNGRLIPCRAQVLARLIEIPALWQEAAVRTVGGYDLSPFNEFSPFFYLQKKLRDYQFRFLSEEAEIFRFDFRSPLPPAEEKSVEFRITADGSCHAIGFWFRLYLDDDIFLETGPSSTSHWDQALQVLPSPPETGGSQKLSVKARHNSHFIYFEIDANQPGPR